MPLNYESHGDGIRRQQQRRDGLPAGTRLARMAAVILLLLISPCLMCSISASWFSAKTNDAAIEGRTSQQIIAKLGHPTSRRQYRGGDETFVYQGPWGAMCGIDFENNVAVRTRHWGR